MGAKIGYDLLAGAPLVVSDFGDGVRSVTLAHIGGAACGAVCCLVGGRCQVLAK